MNGFFGIWIFCIAFFFSHPGGAEVIKLNSGQTVEGKVLKVQKDSVLVDAGVGTPVTYFRDEIKEILPDAVVAPTPISPQISAQADALEARAVELIDQNTMDQGLDLVRQALELDPNPQRHMNYGSILFGNGVELFKQGRSDQAKTILRQAETQLKQAIAGFGRDKQLASNAFGAAQAYFLLGEMYANGFGDAGQARKFYQKAVNLDGHDGAKAALEKL